MVSSTTQLAQSATGNFQFNVAACEFNPSANITLSPHAKEFEFSPLPKQASVVNFDSFSSDDESPRVVRCSNKRTNAVRVPPGLKIPGGRVSKPTRFNRNAKEFVPRKLAKPAGPVRPPPGLEKSLGLSVDAKEFVPPPAAVPVWPCAINLDDYTDDESDDETKGETVNVDEIRGLCSRLASPSIWFDDKEKDMDTAIFSDSEADTAEPSSHDSESEGCSGAESP